MNIDGREWDEVEGFSFRLSGLRNNFFKIMRFSLKIKGEKEDSRWGVGEEYFR